MIKSHVSGIRLKSIFYSLLALSVIIVALSFFLAPAVKQEAKNLQTLTDNQNSVEFSVTPLSISEFNIAINTHSVELAFDPVQVATLKDDSGNIYKPTAWEGSPSGGHHRNGVLRFPPVIKSAKSITLAISYNGERKFEWKLP